MVIHIVRRPVLMHWPYFFANVPSTSKLPWNLVIFRLCRQRFYIIDMASDLKRKVIVLLDQVFPEYEKLFSDIFGVSSLLSCWKKQVAADWVLLKPKEFRKLRKIPLALLWLQVWRTCMITEYTFPSRSQSPAPSARRWKCRRASAWTGLRRSRRSARFPSSPRRSAHPAVCRA